MISGVLLCVGFVSLRDSAVGSKTFYFEKGVKLSFIKSLIYLIGESKAFPSPDFTCCWSGEDFSSYTYAAQ